MNHLTIELKTDVHLIESIISVLYSIAKINHYGKELLWSLEISLREIIVNSMIHGNKNNKEKKVSVEFNWNDKEFVISVKDEGKGFKYIKKEPKNLKKGQIPELSGRGWLIVEDKMDSLKFKKENNGFKAIVVKKIS